MGNELAPCRGLPNLPYALCATAVVRRSILQFCQMHESHQQVDWPIVLF